MTDTITVATAVAQSGRSVESIRRAIRRGVLDAELVPNKTGIGRHYEIDVVSWIGLLAQADGGYFLQHPGRQTPIAHGTTRWHYRRCLRENGQACEPCKAANRAAVFAWSQSHS